MTVKKSESIWTRTFLLLCSAQFLGYAQHAVLTPVLPLYVTHLGGSAFIVGLVLATFAATSVVVRPLVGHWADRWNEAGVMVSGLVFQGVSIFFASFRLSAQRCWPMACAESAGPGSIPAATHPGAHRAGISPRRGFRSL